MLPPNPDPLALPGAPFPAHILSRLTVEVRLTEYSRPLGSGSVQSPWNDVVPAGVRTETTEYIESAGSRQVGTFRARVGPWLVASKIAGVSLMTA